MVLDGLCHCRWPLQFWTVYRKYLISLQSPWVPYLPSYCYVFPFIFLKICSFSISPFPLWSFPIFSDVVLFIPTYPVRNLAHTFYKDLTKGWLFSRGSQFFIQYIYSFAYFSPLSHSLCHLVTPCNDFFLTHSETFEVVCGKVNSFYLKV